MPTESVSVMALTITLAALWQHVAMDQMRPTNEATSLAGTFLLLWSTAAWSFFIADWSLVFRVRTEAGSALLDTGAGQGMIGLQQFGKPCRILSTHKL